MFTYLVGSSIKAIILANRVTKLLTVKPLKRQKIFKVGKSYSFCREAQAVCFVEFSWAVTLKYNLINGDYYNTDEVSKLTQKKPFIVKKKTTVHQRNTQLHSFNITFTTINEWMLELFHHIFHHISSNPGFSSNKPTHYLLDYGDFD